MPTFKLLLTNILLIAQFVAVCCPVVAAPGPSNPQCIEAIDIDNDWDTFDDRPFDCAVASDGTVHIVWVSAGCVYYSCGAADLQTWTAAQKISFIAMPHTNPPNPAVAIVCEHDRVHLMLIDGCRELRHFRSSDSGKTWIELSAVEAPEVGRWGTSICKIMKPFAINQDVYAVHLLLVNGKATYQWILDKWDSSGVLTSVKLADCGFYPLEAALTVNKGQLYLAYWSVTHTAALSIGSLRDVANTKTWIVDQPKYNGDSLEGAGIWVQEDRISLFRGNNIIVCRKDEPKISSKITLAATKHSKDDGMLKALTLLPIDDGNCFMFWISARYEKAYRDPVENGKELNQLINSDGMDELGFIPLPVLVPLLGLSLFTKMPYTSDIVIAQLSNDNGMKIQSIQRITKPNFFCYAPVVCKQGDSILVFWTARTSLRHKVNQGKKKLFVTRLPSQG